MHKMHAVGETKGSLVRVCSEDVDSMWESKI